MTGKLTRRPRYQTLDHWRGVACLCVVIFHATASIVAATGGGIVHGALALSRWLWLGVPMFFVISGYCISATADASRLRGGTVREYFQRRVRRILPPYWVWVGVLALLMAGVERGSPGFWTSEGRTMLLPSHFGGWQWIGNLTLTEGWRPHVLGPGHASGWPWFVGQAWTLGYEEQFYAVTGLILLLAPRRFYAAILVSAGLDLAWSVLALKLHYRPEGFFFHGGWWLQFVAGVGVYYAVNYSRRWEKGMIALLLGMMVMLGVGLVWMRGGNERGTFGAETAFLGAAIFALLILVLHPLDGWAARQRWLQPLQVCGVMCYSMYLTHPPVCVAVESLLARLGVQGAMGRLLIGVPLSVAGAVAVAWVFHRWVERRFLNRRGPGQERGRAKSEQEEERKLEEVVGAAGG